MPEPTVDGTAARLLLVAEPGEDRARWVAWLAREGWAVDARSDAPPAGAAPPSAALVDLATPGGEGAFATLRRRHPAMPVVVVGAADSPGVARAIEEGAYDWVALPVDPRRLRIAARNALERWRLHAPAARDPGSPPARLDELERRALAAALARAEGNVSEVVRELGIGRTTVYRKLRKYGLR